VGAGWRPAATAAGCLVVGAVAAGDLTAPGGLDPIGLALAAALLTTYLVLVDAGRDRWLVPTATVAVAIAATVLATHLPARAWMAHRPVGGDDRVGLSGAVRCAATRPADVRPRPGHREHHAGGDRPRRRFRSFRGGRPEAGAAGPRVPRRPFRGVHDRSRVPG